ncbi:MAG: signal protein PDZ [Candidatus Tectimicrobiota bacterium]|nr:MAG: signal protein PDZ [Candidatus Tectomicrobia bacterium]
MNGGYSTAANGFYPFLHRLLPATVHLEVRIPADHPSAAILGTERMGSGTVIDAAGHILTVGYVVLGARHIRATLPSGESAAARLLDLDFDSGLAVLQADLHPPAPMPLGDPNALAPGQSGFILASTGATERAVTEGVITALCPFDAYWEYMLERAILTTAENPGFGGGAFVTRAGTLVGVVSLNLGALKDWTMVIPLDAFYRIREELFVYGRVRSRVPRAWLGLYPMPSPRGLAILGVIPGGPAARAGVQPGDIIVSINGYEVDSRPEFYRHLWQHRAGAQIALEVMREGQSRTFLIHSQDRAAFFR